MQEGFWDLDTGHDEIVNTMTTLSNSSECYHVVK